MKTIRWNHAAFFVVLFALAACTPKPPKYRTGMNDIQTTLANSIADNKKALNEKNLSLKDNNNVNNELLPPLSVQTPNGTAATKNQRFDVSVKDMPAKDFFMG